MKKNIFLIIGLVFASLLVAVPITFAQNYGLDATAGAAFGEKLVKDDVATIVGNIIGTGLSLISVLFFIMMIYGGIMWMTARGKDEVSKKALDTIFAAIIGIIIVLAAYAITTFVFKAVGGGVGNNSEGSVAITSCAQKTGWSCKDINDSTCALPANLTNDSVKIAACSALTASCAVNLCPGSATNVCCID